MLINSSIPDTEQNKNNWIKKDTYEFILVEVYETKNIQFIKEILIPFIQLPTSDGKNLIRYIQENNHMIFSLDFVEEFLYENYIL
ncbi:MAG: hypothetical protein ACK5NF_07025 [Bacilli bacterium]